MEKGEKRYMVSLSEQCRKENKEHSRSIKSAMSSTARLEVGSQFFSNRVVKDWSNKIHSSLKSENTMKSFKNDYAHLGGKHVIWSKQYQDRVWGPHLRIDTR